MLHASVKCSCSPLTRPMRRHRHARMHAHHVQEFEPWLKWVILDAVLAIVVAALVRRVEPLRPLFESIGWA
jgi:hypothetical protein